jgi:mRNA interferase MazF
MRRGDVPAYCPDAGDLVWLDFGETQGNEQAGRRPALVLSPRAFNELTGRCIACPITRRDRDWSFHVGLPDGGEVAGVVQSDQLRSISWERRGAKFAGAAAPGILEDARAKIKALLAL